MTGRGSFTKWMWTGMTAVALAGSCVDQQKEVSIYRSILDERVPPAPSYEPGQELTLAQALALTNQNRETLAVQGEDYLQALLNKNRAVAAFLPTVTLQPAFTLSDRPRQQRTTATTRPSLGSALGLPSAGGNTGSSSVSRAGSTSGFRAEGHHMYRTEVPVVGEITLFNGFGDIATYRASKEIIEERRLNLLNAQATVLLNAAQVFYQVLRSERQVEVLRNSVQVQQARVRDEEQRFANGLSTKLAVAQTQAQLASTLASLAQAEGDVANGRALLAFVIGVERVDGRLIDDVQVPDVLEDLSVYEQQAAELRQDVLAAQAAVRAARHNVDVAISQYYPSVTLNVTAFLYREYFADASKWNAVLSANLPIFSAGLIEADVRSAWSTMRVAALVESETRRMAIADARTAYANLLASERRIAALRDQVEAAHEALRQAQAGLVNNLAIVLDVLNAQDQVLNAELNLVSAEYDRRVFYLNLLRAVGRLPLEATRATTQPASAPAPEI